MISSTPRARLRSEANVLSIGIERVRQMTTLYRNWPVAFADRAGILPRQSLTVYRIESDFGKASLLAATNRWDVKVINEIWTGRFYDERLPTSLRRKEGLSVVDIGANRGFFTVYAAKRFRAPLILALEPDPENARLLRANIALNDVANATVHQAAVVGTTDTEANLFGATLPGLHTTISPQTAEAFNISSNRYSGEVMRVPAMHIDDALRAGAGPDGRVDFVKVDIEGLELALLEAADLDLLRRTNYLVAETEQRRSEVVVQKLRRAGFRVEEGPWLLCAVRD